MNLLTRYKKVFLVIAFIITTGLLGFLLYKTFFSDTLNISTGEPNASSTTGGLLPNASDGLGQITSSTGNGLFPDSGDINNVTISDTGNNSQPDSDTPSEIAVGGITKTNTINENPSLGVGLSNSGGIQYYDKSDGYFYKVDKSGKITKLSDRVFYNVSAVTWAPNSNKAVLEYPDKSKILYNFETKKQTTLPNHWEDFSFSPQSDEIVAKSIALDPDSRFLITAAEDGSRVTNIEEIGTNTTVKASWSPNNQIIATYSKGLDLNRQEVYFVGLNGENFKSTIVEGRGLTYEWSKTGDRLLYSAYNNNSDNKPLLWIVDAQGDTINQNRQSLGINTWADKCTFASNTEIYCAVPVNLEVGSGLVRALANDNIDEIYKIDLATGVKKLIATPDKNVVIKTLIVDDAQSQLSFSDQNTGAVYQIKLK